ALEREARKALAERRMDEAIAAIERGFAIRDDDRRMARLMKQVRAATRTARDREQAALAREQAAREREQAADRSARLAMARKLSRAGDFVSARRAVENARPLHGDAPELATTSAVIDKAELEAQIRNATKALAAKR